MKMANDLRKDGMIVSCWTPDGKIFVKTSPDGRPSRIYEDDDLQNIHFISADNYVHDTIFYIICLVSHLVFFAKDINLDREERVFITLLGLSVVFISSLINLSIFSFFFCLSSPLFSPYSSLCC